MKTKTTLIILLFFVLSSCKESSNDITPPVISLIGPSQVTTQMDSVYVDAGATAFDETDGDITSDIIVVNPVNVNILGTYYVTYNVTDNAGNKAEEVRRKVTVMIY